MKKLTALLLSLLMLVPMMTMGISAESATTTSLDDKLVLHYDFEGDDIDEAYKNKAPNCQGGNMNKKELTMTWDGAAGTLAYLGTETSGNPPQVPLNYIKSYVSGSVEYTLFTRLKIDDSVSAAGETWVMYNFINNYNSNKKIGIQVQFVDNREGSDDFFQVQLGGTEYRFKGTTFEELKANFVNVAVIVYKGDDNNYYVKMYTSIDKWKPLTEFFANGANSGTELGEPEGHINLIAASRKAGIVFDDFRIYSTDLSVSDLHSICVESFGFSANDALFLHYDFEEDSLIGTQNFKNLVNGGTIGSNGVLSGEDKNGLLDIEWDSENGTLAYKDGGTTSSAFVNNSYLSAYMDKAKEFTVFTRIKLDDDVQKATTDNVRYRFLQKGSTMAINFMDNGVEEDQFWVVCNSINFYFKGITFDDLQAGYVNIALIIYKGTGENADNLYLKMYASKGDPAIESQWTELTATKATTTAGTELTAVTNNMTIIASEKRAGIIMDEFRMYVTDLSVTDLQTIIEEDIIVSSPNMKNIGHQRKYVDSNNDSKNDAFSVRLVGGIDSLAYNYVGIEIYTTVGQNTSALPTKQTSTTVYTSILEENTPIMPSQKDCEYFVAFIIPDIPLDLALEDGEYITLKYRFYAVNDSGTIYSKYSTASYNADGTPVA